MPDPTGISMRGLLGRESKFCSTTRVKLSTQFNQLGPKDYREIKHGCGGTESTQKIRITWQALQTAPPSEFCI